MTDDWNELAWLSGKSIDLSQLLLYAQKRPPLNREVEQYLRELKNDCQKAIWCLDFLIKQSK